MKKYVNRYEIRNLFDVSLIYIVMVYKRSKKYVNKYKIRNLLDVLLIYYYYDIYNKVIKKLNKIMSKRKLSFFIYIFQIFMSKKIIKSTFSMLHIFLILQS